MNNEHELSNMTKSEAVKVLKDVINKHLLHNGLGDKAGQAGTAIRVAIAHLEEDETTPIGTAVDCIFEMYRRNDDVDKSYRNAARFILSAVNGVPARYEDYKNEDARSPQDIIDEGKKRFELPS